MIFDLPIVATGVYALIAMLLLALAVAQWKGIDVQSVIINKVK